MSASTVHTTKTPEAESLINHFEKASQDDNASLNFKVILNSVIGMIIIRPGPQYNNAVEFLALNKPRSCVGCKVNALCRE